MSEGAFEATGVFGCRDAENADKGATHGICRFEAAGVGYLFEPERGAVDDLLSGFDTHSVDELAGVHSCFPETDAREVAGAHAYSLGERFDSESFAKMFDHPYL